MNKIVVVGVAIGVTEEGYFLEPFPWNREIANELALTEGIMLSEQHYLVLEHIRQLYFEGRALTIRAIGNSGITDIKGFYGLFPGAPMKKAAKLAGVPKPASCI